MIIARKKPLRHAVAAFDEDPDRRVGCPLMPRKSMQSALLAVAALAILAAPRSNGLAQDSSASTLRLVTFGTSLTASGGWQGALAAELERCLGRHVDVINLGKGGMASDWGAQSVGLVIAAKPDIVLIEFSGNDASLRRRFVSLKQSQDNIRAIVRALRNNDPNTRIYLMAMNPALGGHGLIRPYLNTYYDSYALLSKELKTGFIDHRPAWANLSDDQLRTAIPDGIHPDPAVARAIIVPNVVRSIVGAGCGGQ
jgi:lysophospholipase L1-like esterase